MACKNCGEAFAYSPIPDALADCYHAAADLLAIKTYKLHQPESANDALSQRTVPGRSQLPALLVLTITSDDLRAHSWHDTRWGMSMQTQSAGRMQATTREIGEITIVDVKGRITIGEGNVMLREIMVGLLEKGKKHVLLNMTDVAHVDSAGIGELVCSHTSVRKRGGQLKLTNVNKRVRELLQKTMLLAVFDVHQDETSAVKSFGLSSKAAG